MRAAMAGISRWFRAPVPARNVSVWREIVPTGVVLIALVAVLPPSEWRSRVAMAALGVITVMMSHSRPASLWNTGRLLHWREGWVIAPRGCYTSSSVRQ
jgi:hypothetical protein